MARKKKTKAEKYVPHPLYLPPRQKAELDALAQETGRTTSWYVREALTEYTFKKYRKRGKP